MTRWRFYVACLVLLLATVPFCTGPLHAQLQCNTQQCICVNFAPNPAQNNWNYYCWLRFNNLDGSFGGYAYSTTYAQNGFGQNALAGAPGTSQNGFYVLCEGTKDCPGAPTVQSGAVTQYTGTAQTVTFNTACVQAVGQ